MKLWIWYASGALLVLLIKLGQYLWTGRKMQKPAKDSLLEWFFEKSPENATSWATTIGVVWAIGVLYIQNLEFSGTEFISKIPDVPAFAFLLGGLMEYAAPAAAKWLIGKLPGAQL